MQIDCSKLYDDFCHSGWRCCCGRAMLMVSCPGCCSLLVFCDPGAVDPITLATVALIESSGQADLRTYQEDLNDTSIGLCQVGNMGQEKQRAADTVRDKTWG